MHAARKPRDGGGAEDDHHVGKDDGVEYSRRKDFSSGGVGSYSTADDKDAWRVRDLETDFAMRLSGDDDSAPDALLPRALAHSPPPRVRVASSTIDPTA